MAENSARAGKPSFVGMLAKHEIILSSAVVLDIPTVQLIFLPIFGTGQLPYWTVPQDLFV
jgi:hypothetical protein